MWERGIRESVLSRRVVARWLVVTVVVTGMVTLTALAGMPAGGGALGLGTSQEPATAAATDIGGAQATAPAPDAVPGELEMGYTLDGTDPLTFPDDPTGLAFLELDAPLESAFRELGPPQAQHPDINATVAHVWHLPGDAELVAVAAGEEPDDPIVGLTADVPPGSAVRLGAYGDVVVGRSTPAEIAAAWERDHDRAEHDGDDFVIRFVLCRGGWPVVVKFDQPEPASWDGAPVTRVLIAYTDDDPQAAGCTAS